MSYGGIQQNISSLQGNVSIEAFKEVAKDEQLEKAAEQQEAQSDLKQALTEEVNPTATRMIQRQKTIKAHSSTIKKTKEAAEKGKRLVPIEQIKDSANKFSKQNQEIRSGVLLLLRERIKPGDTKEDILRILKDFYEDPTLADIALEFLLETTTDELKQTVEEAKKDFENQFEREIKAGKNITEAALKASEKGLGTPTSLRDMYRDITGHHRDPNTLFDELSNKYAFKELQKVINFLLHSIGADLKKGPSIPRGQLHTLLTEVRSLQSILGVYRFFRGRMKLMQGLFQKEGLEMPQHLSFELMAKQFMALAGDRYPSADKVLQSATKLGVEKWIMAKIIAFSQLRDAIREVAINQIYRSVQHRDELYMAIIEALENLEEELEELLEKQEEESGGREEEDEDEEKQKQQQQKKASAKPKRW